MYHVSAQGDDERMINVHYYYLEFSVEPSILPINMVPRDGQVERL